MIKITVRIESTIWRQHLPPPTLWAKKAAAALAESGFKEQRRSTLLLTDDAALKTLNNNFRNKDKATNILSFPSGVPDYLGDMAMAFETCQREAIEEGKTFLDHATHLLIHGLLHLLGYDHINEKEALEMEALEVSLLSRMDIANPYERERHV